MDVWFTQHVGQPDYSQQDSLLVAGQIHQSRNLSVRSASVDGNDLLVAVADGVSASPSAHLSSQLILKLLSATVMGHRDWLDNGLIGGKLIRNISGIFRAKLARGRTWGAATTLAALHVRDGHASVTNCGDSRVYRIRHGKDGLAEWRQLTKDHTILAGMQAKGIAKGINPSDCASIYKGLEHCIVADPEESNVRVHTALIDVAPGDIFLLTSDGIHDVLGDEQLKALYDRRLDISAQVAIWREAVLAAGAFDNLTLAAIAYPPVDGTPPSEEEMARHG